MKRDPVTLDPRRSFTAAQKARLFHMADGRCQVSGDDGEECGNKITVPWIAGHYPVPHNLGGRTVIENGRVEGLCCAPKTHAEDTKVAAKTKRQARETGQQARLERRGHGTIQNRGFDENWTRGVNGKARKNKRRRK